ncbi:hypothetical protein ACXYW7_02785 [Mesomycoplasma ovipneumoniae]|uniref:hypothetical protein n=1 Tax=Mesomycoplasma ovipneumoniae TaxID=29562 RepID=UPI0029645B65|nr:hypothetical protein [Mesomycoplasma ovipneumoniae]MDW2933571.1 hypothetical protein [Mesomycoplasma ovipneumoniae]
MNFNKKVKKIFRHFLFSSFWIPQTIFIIASCGDTDKTDDGFKNPIGLGVQNAVNLKKFINSENLIEIPAEKQQQIYEQKDSQFYLLNLTDAPKISNSQKIDPEYISRFSPNSEITYLNLINRYYNSKQLQKTKRQLNQGPDSIYVPTVAENAKDFWFVYVIPTSVGFTEFEQNGQKISIPETSTKLPRTLTPYSSVELKLLKKDLISNDNKNYLQINVNQMLNSFAYKRKDPNDPQSTEKNLFGFLESETFPNYKLYLKNIDFEKKEITFTLDEKQNNLKHEITQKNSLDSNISVINLEYKSDKYEKNANPEAFFSKTEDPKDKLSDYPFVRFFTQTFVVPFEGKTTNFDNNFSIIIEKK